MMGKIEEIMSGAVQDAKAVKEIRQADTELEALPEFEGSILYKMEVTEIINDLGSLQLIISDKRLDDASVAEEIRKVAGKVQPSSEKELSDEQAAIEKAKAIAFDACIRAMDSVGA